MLIRNFSKVFSYANRSRNHLFYFSKNSSFQIWPKVIPNLTHRVSKNYEPYYLSYLMNKMDYYNSVYDINCLFAKKESDSETIKLISDLNNEEFLNNENCIYEVLKNAETELDNYGVDEICKILFWTCNKFSFSCNDLLRHFKKCLDKKLCKIDFSRSELLKILFTISVGCSQFRTYSNYFFQYKGILKFLDKIDQLSAPEIVQVFYCIPARDFSEYENKFNLFLFLNDNIDVFNSDELGIIARGLLAGNIMCNHENICDTVLDKTVNDLENIHSVPLKDICRVIQRLLRSRNEDRFLNFQEKVIPHISKFDNKSLLHIVSMGSKLKILNPHLKAAAVNKWKECIKDLTFSEISKLIYSATLLNIQEEDIFSLAIKNMEGVTLTKDYPALISFLSNLSFHQLYPENLLCKVLSEDLFHEICENFTVATKVNWWNLYWNVKLEKPECIVKEFDYSSLKKLYKTIRFKGKIFSNFQNVKIFRFYRIIANILEAKYGKNKFLLIDVLPHFEVGLIMRFNKELEAQDIPEEFCGAVNYLKKPLDDGHYWIFILILKINDFLWCTDTLCLPNETQCRQLKALGYSVIMVEERSLHNTNQKEYIMNLMQESLKNLSEENK